MTLVLWIHILVTILKLFDVDPGCKKKTGSGIQKIRCGSRILIRGSMPLTNGSVDPDPIFVTDLQDANKTEFFF